MPERRLAAILCADVAGYSRLMGADEDGTLARLKAIRTEIMEPRLRAHGGRMVKASGDGFLVEFASAVAAVRCAVELQDAVARREAPQAPDRRIAFRTGVNLGDIVRDGDDVFRDGVNVAARLEQLAGPGEVLVSRKVFEEIRDKIAVNGEALGPHEFKNIARPVEVVRVRPASGYVAAAPAPRRRPALAIGAALALVAAATAFVLVERAPGPRPDAAATPTAAPGAEPRAAGLSVAVLPFANLGGDPGKDYLADGLTEDLITDLSRISGAFVTSRNTAFTYKGRTVDVRQVGEELGVRYVLEGSVRRGGGRVRVNAQLVDAQTGTHVWADRFDIAAEDAYALQDQITGRIARALNIELKEAVSRRAARGRPEDLEAADLATHGWAILFNKPQTPETNAEARPILERAIALDPRNAEAWTGLAYMHVRAGLYGWSPSRTESYRLALEAGERAVALDPRSADAHYVLGFAVRQSGSDPVRARQLFERCIELNPNYAPAYFWMALIEIQEGRPELAPALVDKAFKLSPRDGLTAVFYYAKGLALLLLGEDEAALRAARAGIAANAQHANNYAVAAAVLAHRGESEAAGAALRRFVELRRHDRTIADWIKSQGLPDDLVRRRYGRFLDGLRKAGMPEA